jgi:hypothetical protein
MGQKIMKSNVAVRDYLAASFFITAGADVMTLNVTLGRADGEVRIVE